MNRHLFASKFGGDDDDDDDDSKFKPKKAPPKSFEVKIKEAVRARAQKLNAGPLDKDTCDDMYFLTPEYFRNHNEFIRCQDIDPQYLQKGTQGKEMIFVSHRWQTPENPDPKGSHFRLVASERKPKHENSVVWYDYSCMPQVPRTDSESKEFKGMLGRINTLAMQCNFSILVHEDDYYSRSWCVAEYLMMRNILLVKEQPPPPKGVARIGLKSLNPAEFLRFDTLAIPLLLQLLKVDSADEMVMKVIDHMIGSTQVTNGGDKAIVRNILVSYVNGDESILKDKVTESLKVADRYFMEGWNKYPKDVADFLTKALDVQA